MLGTTTSSRNYSRLVIAICQAVFGFYAWHGRWAAVIPAVQVDFYMIGRGCIGNCQPGLVACFLGLSRDRDLLVGLSWVGAVIGGIVDPHMR